MSNGTLLLLLAAVALGIHRLLCRCLCPATSCNASGAGSAVNGSSLSALRPLRSTTKNLLCALVACELVGCVHPRPENSDTIQNFADRVRDKSYGGTDWIQPSVAAYCRVAGGVLQLDRDPQAADGLICMMGLTPLWSFQPNARRAGNTNSTYVLTPRVLSAEQVAADQRAKWDAGAEARGLGADRFRREAEEAGRQQALAAERLKQYQRDLKAGVRFEWRVPGRDFMTAVGTVIRLENETMVFVQFDNLRISGQVTRSVPRSELRPVQKEVQRAFFETP